jgi:predicted metal-binding membrane protein
MIIDSLDLQLDRQGRTLLFGLVGLVAVAWLYLVTGAGVEMDRMDMGNGQMMAMPPVWSFGYGARVFVMWAVMMVAMMLPSELPTIARVVGHVREQPASAKGIPTALLFTAGYLVPLIGFGIAATFLQWRLDSAQFLSETMVVRSALLGWLLVVAVGLFQLSPLKQALLHHCRLSLRALAEDRRQSAWNAMRLGMRRGLSCIFCCLALMCLLFAGGVMNLLWIAAIASLLFAETTLPWGDRVARLAGVGLVAWGSVTLAIATL